MYWLRYQSAIVATLTVLTLLSPAYATPADDQYAVAAAHYTRGRWQLAADEFKTFLGQFPDDDRAPVVVFFLGETLVQLQRLPEAGERFSEFLRRAPVHAYARQAEFRRGEIAFLQGEQETAQRQLNSFHERFPQDPLNAYALAYLGELALTNKNGERAEGFFREALSTFAKGPLHRECRFGLARALELQEDFEEAVRFYRFLADNDQGSLADDAQLQIGVLLQKQGRHTESIEAFESFATDFPDSDLLADALYWMGQAQLAAGHYRDAAGTLGLALSDARERGLSAAIEFSLGQALRKSGDARGAESHYVRVVEQWPESDWADDALQILVEDAFATARYDRVETLGRQFEERFAASPLRPRVRQTFGRSCLKQQRYGEAEAVFAELSRRSPAARRESDATQSTKVGDAVWRANCYYLALAHLGAGEYDEALVALEAVHPAEDERELISGLHVARASALVALRRYNEAVQPLRAYLEVHPEGADAAECLARLTVALAETDDFAAAEKVWEQFAAQYADHATFLPTTRYLAERAQVEKNRKLAKRLFTRLTEAGASDEFVAVGLAGLGKVQLDSGEAGDSASTFSELLRRAPQSEQAAEAAFLRARSLESAGQREDALEAYLVVRTKFGDSPHAPPAMFAAAKLHEVLGQLNQASRLLKQLLEQHPDFAQTAAAQYQLAWILKELDDPGAAAAVYERIAEDGSGTPYWSDAVYRLAESAAREKDYARAESLLTRLLAADPAAEIRAHALYLQGKIAADQGRWSDVAAPMQALAEGFPDHPLQLPAQYWTGEAWYRLGETEKADDVFTRLAEEADGVDDAWLAMVPLRRAQLWVQREQWQDAFDLASGIAERFPGFRQQYEVDYLLGRCLSSEARFNEARATYQRVVRSPTGGGTETAAMAQWMIGETYFHQRDFDQAIRAYHRVESLYGYPKWQAAALLQAGKCHELKGEFNEAIQTYAQLLKDYSETTYAADAASRVGNLRTNPETLAPATTREGR